MGGGSASKSVFGAQKLAGHDQPHLHVLASRLHQNGHQQDEKSQQLKLDTPKDVSSQAILQAHFRETAMYHPQHLIQTPSPAPNHAESEATLADEEIYPPQLDTPSRQQTQQFVQQQQPQMGYNYSEAPMQSQQQHILPFEPRIGDYILTETIGEGTFGKVKLGIHYQNGEKCAVKAIQKSKIKTVKQMNSVQREVRLMKLLKHPHIVDVKETLEDGDQIFLIMEYANGGELFDYIAQQCQQDENMARLYFRQVVSAINYCHHVPYITQGKLS
ncbi:UNVERIFIED_CONTAM: Protein kinase [Siphonaria sp. JEL0065]|nr:Protein kinase [Siphonaria sp. JEL0065]